MHAHAPATQINRVIPPTEQVPVPLFDLIQIKDASIPAVSIGLINVKPPRYVPQLLKK